MLLIKWPITYNFQQFLILFTNKKQRASLHYKSATNNECTKEPQELISNIKVLLFINRKIVFAFIFSICEIINYWLTCDTCNAPVTIKHVITECNIWLSYKYKVPHKRSAKIWQWKNKKT